MALSLARHFVVEAPHEDAARFFDPEEPFDDCAALLGEQHGSDRRLIAFCETLRDDQMDAVVLLPRRTGVERDAFHRILAHLFQHQIHHRGQAHAMLAGTRVKPPPLDEFYCANEAHLRAPDFEELGFSEDAIWRVKDG